MLPSQLNLTPQNIQNLNGTPFGCSGFDPSFNCTGTKNLTFSPDSSDGAYQGARDALIQGVIAAKDEARRRGFAQLTTGFNWFYRTDPSSEASFWGYLRDHGGPRFVAAVDWVGLDAYPGTVFPPAEPPGGERDGMAAAMSQLRKCFMPIAGLVPSVPIHVEENGWPTGPGRDEDRQAAALETMVRAVHDFRGTYNVTDYRWFDLRDHNTSSLNFQHHYGLLRDDYSPKPAFDAYRRLIDGLARREPHGGLGPPRLALRLAYRRGHCKGRGWRNVRRVVGDGVLTSDGRLWQRQRRLAQPSFQQQACRELAGVVGTVVEAVLARRLQACVA